MYAVEFQTKVHDGSISVPEKYLSRFKNRVRVILMTDDETASGDFIDQLLANSVEIEEFTPINREELHDRN